MVDDLKKSFTSIQIDQIPRIQNKVVDTMAMIGSLIDMLKNRTKCEFLVEKLLIPAYDILETKMVCAIMDPASPWYQDIYTYLHDHTLPPNLTQNQHKTFIQCSYRYIIIGDTLYHHGYDGTLLGCLNETKSHTALTKAHSGVCGAHSNGMALAKKILQVGYY